ncbi:MAG TPA: hypothetical protein VES42_07975 [Pilimelia sp.]|nr:hypothetical protein [Pilimelia sp.]
MRKLTTATALLTLPVLALLGSAPASAAASATFDLTSATLVARGAAVDLGVTVTCPAGDWGYVSAAISQRSGSSVAHGTGSSSFFCTGAPQTMTLRAVAQPGGVVFKRGEAAVTASLQGCSEFECWSQEANETVVISR